MSFNNSSHCDDLLYNDTFITWTFTLFLISFISLLGNLFLLFLLLQNHTLHSNVRLLLKNFAFCACLLSAYMLLRCFYQFYIWQYGQTMTNRFRCSVYEILFDVMLITITLSMASIGLDRVINTLWKRTYSDTDRPTSSAYAMLATAWISGLSITTIIVVYTSLQPDADVPVCYCHSWLVLPLSFTYFACPSFVLLDVVTMFCYVFLHRKSRRAYLNFNVFTTEHSLIARHQIMSNINTTVLLMPTLIVHSAFYAAITLAIMVIKIAENQTGLIASHINYTMLFTNLVAVDAALHPLLFLTRHDSMSKAAAKYVPRWLRRILEQKKRHRIEYAPAKYVKPNSRAELLEQRFTLFRTRKTSLVDFRLKPELHEDILKAIWDTKPIKSSKSKENSSVGASSYHSPSKKSAWTSPSLSHASVTTLSLR